MSRYRSCRNCRFWQCGAPADMSTPVATEAAETDTGVCEAGPPILFELADRVAAYQPVTHASRSCFDFTPRDGSPYSDDDHDPDPPDDGERNPSSSRIRRMFPQPPHLIAA